jgi:hypothetical protein
MMQRSSPSRSYKNGVAKHGGGGVRNLDEHDKHGSVTAKRRTAMRTQHYLCGITSRFLVIGTLLMILAAIHLVATSLGQERQYTELTTSTTSDTNSDSLNKDAATNIDDGPPVDLVVHGNRDHYTPVPQSAKRCFLAEGKGMETLTRAFRNRGWKRVSLHNESQIYYRARGARGRYYYENMQPWQRYSRVPGISHLESKDGFLAGFRRYQNVHPAASLYFLPETYRLSKKADKKAFQLALQQGGKHRPWVLKQVSVNNGRGIEMLGPNSQALETAIERADNDTQNDYIAQAYICNELTWFHGEKFDLRMYWLVASVDPPIVLYHDGYVRVGAATYNESDFSSTAQHLTNHIYRGEETSNVTKHHLWERLLEHYQANHDELSPRIRSKDPVRHVRNQMKEALATTVAAFLDVSFGNAPDKVVPENFFVCRVRSRLYR